MSADKPDKLKPQGEASQDADDERTQFMPLPDASEKDLPQHPPSADDGDRTQFMPLFLSEEGGESAEQTDDKVIESVPSEEDDRTTFAPLPEALDKTETNSDDAIRDEAQQSAPSEPESSSVDDKTMFAPIPKTSDESAPRPEEAAQTETSEDAPIETTPTEDEDRTMFVPMPEVSSESDLPSENPSEGAAEKDMRPEDEDRTMFVAMLDNNGLDDKDKAQTEISSVESDATAAPEEPESIDDDGTQSRSSTAPQKPSANDVTISPLSDDQPEETPAPAIGEGTRPPGSEDRTQFPPDSGASVPPIPQPHTAALATVAAVGSTGIGIGTLINNNYEIRQVLKSGGMGEVYRGVEIGTGDPVAIKAILPELAEDEKAGLLFKREARTLRQLADEAIVRYYNYVHDRDLDRYFLVMEFIEGVPLSDHIEKHGAIPAPAAMTLLKRLAKGLSRAHAQDVIHRDLSPDNVMLAEGDVTQARLIDFGIAKSNVVKEGTMRGQFAGKFKYVAPEQLGHYDGEIGPGTDIYGLGLLICAAALGRPLNMGASIVEAVQSRQSIPNLAGVPAALVPLVSHMLEPNPARRPASMDEVRSMLENPGLIPVEYRQGLPPPPAIELTGRGPLPTIPPVTTPPPGLQVPTSAFPYSSTTTRTTIPPLDPIPEERRSGLSTFLVLVFLAVIGGGGWYAWQSGMIDAQLGQTATPSEDEDVVKGIPEPQSSTRAGFLASFDTGACTYTSRIAAGSNAGMIEGYSSTGEIFSGLPVSYEEKFGARPAILPREVTVEQCAALDFARALQGRDHPPVTFQMFADEVQSENEISGQIRTGGEQTIWPVLVAPNGGVYNLSGRMSAPVNWQRSLRFGMRLEEGATAVPQLILVVSSDKPLALTATAQPGALAAELLPLLLEEIAERGGAASASLAYVLLTPPL